MNESTTQLNWTTGTCRMGWSGTKVHAIQFLNGEPRNTTICQQYNNHSWKTPVAISKKPATRENVTCENCLTHIK